MLHRSVRLAMIQAALAGAAGAPVALAQQFTNGDFATGDLSGWTVQLTPNGTTFLQGVTAFDIDGTGPLAPGPAARFQVGRINATTPTGGVDLFQTVDLTSGVEYAVTFWVACDTTMATSSNGDGGRFGLLFNGAEVGSPLQMGSIYAGCRKYGFVERRFSPVVGGPHAVGARITRGFTTSGSRQYADNFDIRPAVTGACCRPDATCADVIAPACAAQLGTYHGDQTICAQVNCPQPPLGACCLNDGTCTVTAAFVCATSEPQAGMGGGSFQGAGSTCAAAACPARLHTSFGAYTPDNQLSEVNAGAFLDLTAASALSVTRLDFFSGAEAGNWMDVQVWTFPGSYVGNDASQAGWSLHETLAVRSLGSGSRAPLNLATPIAVGAGQTVGVYLIAGGGGIRFRGTAAAPATQTTFTDGTLTVFTDRVRTAPWAGTLTTGRSWSGSVLYAAAGGPPACYANCDGSTQPPVLNVQDFSCFLTRYAGGESYANCDASTQSPVLNVQDFSCFLTKYAAGCP